MRPTLSDAVDDIQARPPGRAPRPRPPQSVAAPVAVGELESVLQRVARVAAHAPVLGELDINPLIVSAGGAVAVDARIRVASVPAGSPEERTCDRR